MHCRNLWLHQKTGVASLVRRTLGQLRIMTTESSAQMRNGAASWEVRAK